MNYSLGIDIGTSKVAAVIFDIDKKKVISVSSEPTNADTKVASSFAEQQVDKILSALDVCINKLDADAKKQIQAIGITGQMHGVMLWNSANYKTSNLITWQDRRSENNNSLLQIQEQSGEKSLKSGYGIVSLAWLVKNNPKIFNDFDQASTIYDFVASKICGLNYSVTDPTSAASWGCYLIKEKKWDLKKIDALKINKKYLPKIFTSASTIGTLNQNTANNWEIPVNIPVTVPVGDNQASILSTLKNENEDIGLTLGTGGQLVIISKTAAVDFYQISESSTYEIRPYFGESVAVVAAALCGGSAWGWLPNFINNMLKDLGLPELDRHSLFERINNIDINTYNKEIKIYPNFTGERYNCALRGRIEGITVDNFSIDQIAIALGYGIIENLKNMLPNNFYSGKKRVICSGNGIRKSPLLQKITEKVFDLPIVLSDSQEEAAQGAAMLTKML